MSARRARFEEMPSGGGKSGATNWPEARFALFFPILSVLCFVAVMVLLISFVFPGTLTLLGLARRQAPIVTSNVTVWADRETGFYHCPGSVLYRRTSGEAMNQAQALSLGYRPIAGVYCVAGPIPVVKPAAQH
jgi:hypothetical protein